MRIDLHTHSAASDGTDPPAGLMRVAADAGLDVVALTDHDTTEGWDAAAAALPSGLTLVRGAELSCAAPDGRGGSRTVHLLGYLFDPDSEVVRAEQRRLRERRRARLRVMAEWMAADGLPVDPDAVLAGLADDVPAGRPHLAMALVRAGLVATVDEAFASYLSSAGRYHVRRQDTPVAEAISMVADAGGVTVLAHPFAATRGRPVDAGVLAELAGIGLVGVEVDHPDHPPETRRRLHGLAAELGLLATGSSDYHGGNKRNRIGQDRTAPAVYEALVERASGAKVIQG